MDKMTFASYKFKPSDVINALNRYFAKTKANRYLRVPLEIKNGVWTGNPDYRKDIVFTNSPPDRHTRSGHVCWKYYLICDPEAAVGVAINWLREEHDIFYTPGMEAPVEDFDVDEAAKEHEKATRRDLIETLQRRLHEAKQRIVALEKGHAEKSKIIDRQVAKIKELEEQLREANKELANHRVTEGWFRKDNSDLAINVANLKEQLRVLRYDILKVYREIFDRSNGDPEGTDEETLNYTSALYDINEEYKRVVSLQEFRDNVCEMFDIPSNMADNYILKEIHDVVDRFDELEDFRADICGALDIEGMLGTPKQNDKYILEQVEKLKGDSTSLDRYTRFRSNICTALCLGGETSDADILERVRKTKECHDKLCKDYAKLHDDYDSAQKQLKGFTNRCDSLENLHRDLWEFRKNAIEDLKNRGFFFRPEENETLPEIYTKLLKRYDDYFSRYTEQYRLRQQWHEGYESEHERANCVQKALDREREKCRVKDISLETAKKQYEKACNNLETAECALNGMKSKVRELQEEKTKVITALGQDIWDDCLK